MCRINPLGKHDEIAILQFDDSFTFDPNPAFSRSNCMELDIPRAIYRSTPRCAVAAISAVDRRAEMKIGEHAFEHIEHDNHPQQSWLMSDIADLDTGERTP